MGHKVWAAQVQSVSLNLVGLLRTARWCYKLLKIKKQQKQNHLTPDIACGMSAPSVFLCNDKNTVDLFSGFGLVDLWVGYLSNLRYENMNTV